MVDAAVSHLDDLHTLEDFLLNLGRKHQAVGVNTQSFAVRAALYFYNNSLITMCKTNHVFVFSLHFWVVSLFGVFAFFPSGGG